MVGVGAGVAGGLRQQAQLRADRVAKAYAQQSRDEWQTVVEASCQRGASAAQKMTQLTEVQKLELAQGPTGQPTSSLPHVADAHFEEWRLLGPRVYRQAAYYTMYSPARFSLH